MNTDKTEDEKILDFFMDDNLQFNKDTIKKPILLDLEPEKDKNSGSKDRSLQNEVSMKDHISIEKTNTSDTNDTDFEELDYAILKSIHYGFKTNREISKVLKIRSIIVEKHIYKLLREGYIKYFEHAFLTSLGNSAILDFEKNKSEDIWKPIDRYIVSVIENRKEFKLKAQKTIDVLLLALILILIILIIYFGIFY